MSNALILKEIDTIAAIATPVGIGGIGVIRLSGPDACQIASAVWQSGNVARYSTHSAHYGRLIFPVTGEIIDDAVLTVFLAPKSYTGEDVVELSCHGSIAVLQAALSSLLELGARLAEPGEFTKRAFLNGKLDLAQAEAVNDLIRARTDGALRVAADQLAGKLSRSVNEVAEMILQVTASIEAAIDFPDDVEPPDPQRIFDGVERAREILSDLVAGSSKGMIFREGLKVAIVGRVNVGKSSLLNSLLRHARAIVTPIPGTTRDVIEESLQIQGIPMVAIDTAGLRPTDDPVEKIGLQRTNQALDKADLVLMVFDASEGITSEDEEVIAKAAHKAVIAVLNKIDIAHRDQIASALAKLNNEIPVVAVSAFTSEGIDDLESEIAALVSSSDIAAEEVFVSNIRHRQSLQDALESLGEVIVSLQAGAPIDLLSVDLAGARMALGNITGETASEDLLDRIFSEFCIGK